MLKNKKRIIIFVIIFLFVTAICISPIVQFLYVSSWKYQVEDFEMYEKDFQLMVDFTRDYFKSNETSQDINNTLHTGYDTLSKEYTLWNNNGKIEISENVQNSLNTIVRKAFNKKSDSNFHKIIYNNDKICFEIDNGQYGLVYTFDGKKPHFDNIDKKVYTKRIKENWYHVLIK